MSLVFMRLLEWGDPLTNLSQSFSLLPLLIPIYIRSNNSHYINVPSFLFLYTCSITQSQHPEAERHAAARAVSGGPVYISDKPGQHGPDVIRQLILADGSVPRPKRPALPSADSLFRDVQRDVASALKLASANACSGVVATFNVQGQFWDRISRQFVTTVDNDACPAVTCHVAPADVHEIRKLERLRTAADGAGPRMPYAADSIGRDDGAAAGPAPPPLYAAYVRGAQRLQLLHGADEGIEVSVARSGVELVTFAPVLAVPPPAPRGKKGVSKAAGLRATAAVLGLTGLMNPGGAVEGVELGPGGLLVGLRGDGLLLLYCSERPGAVAIVADPSAEAAGASPMACDFEYDAASGALRVAVPAVPSKVGDLEAVEAFELQLGGQPAVSEPKAPRWVRISFD